jgi:hypothetical protein
MRFVAALVFVIATAEGAQGQRYRPEPHCPATRDSVCFFSAEHAPVAAGVVRSRSTARETIRWSADSTRSLGYHMKRGAVYGAITGAVLGGLVVIAISKSGGSCCEQRPARVTFGESVGILAAGSAGGAIIGATLGYSYHFNQ